MLKNKNGFTLVEILIVVVIIGILASLTIPRMTGQSEKARVAEAIGILSAMKRGEVAYFNEHGAYLPVNRGTLIPTTTTSTDVSTWAQIGMQPPVSNFWAYYVPNAATGFAVAARNSTSRPSTCTGSLIAIILLFDPATGQDPWGSSSGCYATNQPYHPAS